MGERNEKRKISTRNRESRGWCSRGSGFGFGVLANSVFELVRLCVLRAVSIRIFPHYHHEQVAFTSFSIFSLPRASFFRPLVGVQFFLHALFFKKGIFGFFSPLPSIFLLCFLFRIWVRFFRTICLKTKVVIKFVIGGLFKVLKVDLIPASEKMR